ncbi:LysR family transcriptional regulator [Methylobacterium symbioticum]|uniref:HTH-type transcriptional regulator PgrR n=1 Tax=Methylobacterium symbioticum TaxID=2584084 RepID=A0A509EBU8_9HYPH|nr:LysR family transcriptional regulator [Methylobacterium symbioticum]VUD71640.1 HTH-type transcriptional regulator PgrR [Methylobacterium symbioticum]
MSASAIDWEDQKTFLAVLDGGSLSDAARRLGLAQPTVRRRIEALERALGTALFTRSPNGLAATEQARVLAEYVRSMARASDAFVRAASDPPGRIGGTVRITASEFVGITLLPRMLAPLRRAHPDLRVELALSNAAADMLGQEADIAVRMSQPSQDALVAKRVGTIPLCFFAHRGYVAWRGSPADLAALAAHDLIGPDRASADLALLASLAPTMARAAVAIRTDSHVAQHAAIRAGLGIGVLQEPVGRADPCLVPVLPGLVLHRLETWIVTHEDLRGTPRVAVTFDHLVAAFTDYARHGLAELEDA